MWIVKVLRFPNGTGVFWVLGVKNYTLPKSPTAKSNYRPKFRRLLNMYPIKILKNLQQISRQFIRHQQKNWPSLNWIVWRKYGARNIPMQYPTGNKTGTWCARFSDSMMISEGLCIPQILLKESTANSVKWQKPRVVFPVTVLWKKCCIWQVRM